jgi:hypothetical protein
MMKAVMAAYKEMYKEMQKAKQLNKISFFSKYSVSPLATQSVSLSM